jgi:hypothetical protein
MNNVRVPGVVWAIGIVIAVYLIQKFSVPIQEATGIDAFVLNLIIVPGLIGVLKGLNLGTDQLNQALDVIDLLLQRTSTPELGQTRGPGIEQPAVMKDDIPERPNPVMRFLVG